MINKEDLRKALGREGDYSSFMADMFGSAYLDHPDDSEAHLTGEAAIDWDLRRVNTVMDRMFANLPPITCATHQEILRRHIQGQETSFEEIWQTTAHNEVCFEPICRRLNAIACMDKFYKPDTLTEIAKNEGLL